MLPMTTDVKKRSEVARALHTAAEGGLLGLLARSWIGDRGRPGFATDDGDFRPASLKQLWPPVK